MVSSSNKRKFIGKKLIFAILFFFNSGTLLADPFSGMPTTYKEKKFCIYCGDVRNNYSQANTDNRTTTKNSCPFCVQLEEKDDERYVIVKRFDHAFLKLNDAPYTEGTALVLPHAHVKSFEDMSKEDSHSFLRSLFVSAQAIKQTMKCSEIHMGLNMGREAGASQPSHMHWHIIPVQNKDRVISLPVQISKKSNTEIYQQLRNYFNSVAPAGVTNKNTLCTTKNDCHTCVKPHHKIEDNKDYVIAETKHAIIKLSTQPLHNGHVLYIPKKERVSLSAGITQEELEDISTFLTRMPYVYQELFGTQEVTSLNFHISELIAQNADEQVAAYISAIPRRAGDMAFLQILACYPLVTRDMDVLYENFKKRWQDLDDREQAAPLL